MKLNLNRQEAIELFEDLSRFLIRSNQPEFILDIGEAKQPERMKDEPPEYARGPARSDGPGQELNENQTHTIAEELFEVISADRDPVSISVFDTTAALRNNICIERFTLQQLNSIITSAIDEMRQMNDHIGSLVISYRITVPECNPGISKVEFIIRN